MIKTKDVNFNEKSGITLIALVISIIVLLILAGVSISMLTGENGILNQATNATDKTKIATEKEQLDLTIATSIMNENAEINKTSLVEELNKLQEEGTIAEFNPANITDDVIGVTITGTSGTEYMLNLVTGEMKEAPTLGTAVENYNTEQGLEWKVFYIEKDTTSKYYGDVYLITSDYVPIAKLPTTALLTTANTYNAYWSSSTIAFKTNSGALSLSDTLTLFKGTGYDISSHSGNNNSKAVSTLLNTSNWTDFVDSNYADYAIGGPTIEMWVASWNATYSSNPIWCSAGTGSGYYFGTGTTSTLSYYANLSSYEGYRNTLYYPHTSFYINCSGYWLASTSASESNYVSCVHFNSCVGSLAYEFTNLGLRPLVHLKSGVTLQDNGTSYTLK